MEKTTPPKGEPMPAKNNMTMEAFARLCGLSRPTVSRYFNDPDAVRSKTQKIIKDAIEQYNYTPNVAASSLIRGQMRAIGIIIPSLIDPFYSALVNAIERATEGSGYLTVLQSSHNDPKRERRAISRLLSLDVAGIAIAPLGYRSDANIILAAREQVPLVIMDSRLQADVPYIGTRNAQSIAIMVDYLCASGPPPALFTMPPMNVTVVERQAAYCARMVALGHAPTILNPDDAPIQGDYETYGYQRFLALAPHVLEGVKSILCPNDRVALGVIAAAQKRGFAVGKEAGALRIAGHDGQHFGAFTSPALTTVEQDIEKLGETVAAALLKGPSHKAFHQDILFDGHFTPRDSA
jgi:DNA-binding LacI/PurR family transcriptional regulator